MDEVDLLIHNDPIVVTPDDRIGLRCPCIDEFALPIDISEG